MATRASLPRPTAPWLDHLAREGNTVVYPTYQTPLTFPSRFLPNALAGIRTALARVPVRRDTLVVAGHSAGGALGADYAAIADAAGLPPARAVFAVYPGRELRRVPISIPAVDGSRIPAATDVTALAGARDATVGTATAREIVAGATRVPAGRKRYELVRDRAVDMHLGPLTTGTAARRVFWDRLDRIIARARRCSTTRSPACAALGRAPAEPVRAQASGSRPSHVPWDPWGRKRAKSSSEYQSSARVRRTTSRWSGRP